MTTALLPRCDHGPRFGIRGSVPRHALCFGLVLAVVATAPATATVADRATAHVERALSGGLEPHDFHLVQTPLLLADDLADWRVSGELLDRLAAARRSDPLMRAAVRTLRLRHLVEQGRRDEARALFRTMGGMSRWWVAGPEDLDELEDLVRIADPPATAWRPAAGTDPQGWVRLEGLGWPARRQLLYLATTVASTEARPAAIRLGAAQGARVWVNGQLVLTTPRPLARGEDQAAAGCWLERGNNLIVVAVGSESDDWWLRLRLTAPDGGTLAGIAEIDTHPAPGTTSDRDREPPPIRTLQSELRAAVAAGRDGAMTAWAAYMVLRRPEAVGAGSAIEACRAARAEEPALARFLEWLVTPEAGAARELLEGAVAADPGLLRARVELARWYAGRGLWELAGRTLEPARDEPAAAAAALDLDVERWGPVPLPALTELAREHPHCIAANAALTRRALDLNRWQLAAEGLARLQDLVPGSAATLPLADRLSAECGDAAALREIHETLVAHDPNRPDVRMRLARLVAADDRHEAAVEVLERGLERSPDDVELLTEVARLAHAAGEDGRAVELARKVLELRPQDRRAQRLLELLGARSDDRSWLRTPAELRALASTGHAGDTGVVLVSHTEIRLLPGNLTERRRQEAILVTSSERADRLRTYPIPYVAESQRLRVLAARVLRPDGSEVAARQRDSPRLAEPELNLYYDTRLRLLRFGELEAGDIVEIAWVVSETVEANETGPYEGGLLYLAQELPVARVEVVAAGPEAALPQWEVVHLEDTRVREATGDGQVRLSWTWEDLEAWPDESPPSPPLTTRPHMVWSNHATWYGLGDWYARHIAPRVRSSRQVEETAARLTEGVDDRLDRIGRLYRFVTNEIRYVGLEFGEHRFRPFSADWVLNHRIGDCKDKAALLIALLEAVDIPARFVMIRTSDQGPARSDTALLEIFNHAIVYLPEDDLWLDGTASGHALFPPPGLDQQATVMVIGDATPRQTPVLGGGLARYRLRLMRAEGATLELTLRLDDTGEAADRRRLELAGSRDDRRVRRWLQQRFPGAELAGPPELTVIPSHDPTVVELRARIPRGALAAGGGLPTLPRPVEWIDELRPSPDRTTPMIIPVRPDLEWALEVELGRPPRPLPSDVTLETDFGSLRVDHEATETGYRVHGYLKLVPGLLEATEARSWSEFLGEVKRHLGRPLEIP